MVGSRSCWLDPGKSLVWLLGSWANHSLLFNIGVIILRPDKYNTLIVPLSTSVRLIRPLHKYLDVTFYSAKNNS